MKIFFEWEGQLVHKAQAFGSTTIFNGSFRLPIFFLDNLYAIQPKVCDIICLQIHGQNEKLASNCISGLHRRTRALIWCNVFLLLANLSFRTLG